MRQFTARQNLLRQLDPLTDGRFGTGEQALDIFAMARPNERGS
jgi:hypothetical protein